MDGTDGGDGNSGTLTYEITEQSPQEYFTINNNGIITATKLLDHNEIKQEIMTVSVISF